MKGLLKLISLFVCSAALSASGATSPTNAAVFVSPELPVQIVVCHEDADMDALLEEFQITPKFRYRAINGFAAPMDAGSVERLKEDPRISSVEADGPVALLEQTIPTGVVRMGVDQFPVARINGIPEPLDVDVAVLDTGISPHDDLNVVHFFSTFTSNPNDENGHGTAMAGIIGAIDNDFGVVGVAPGVRLWNIKTLDASGMGTWTDAIGGMDYAWQHADQISVANMSSGNAGGGLAPINSIRGMVRRLVSAGIVVVAGAGNDGGDIAGPDGVFYQIIGAGGPGSGVDDFVPAAFSEAMAVSSMNPETDTFSPTSNFNSVPRSVNYVYSPGGAIDVVAPGINILTTATNNGYRIGSGTSASTAHGSGLVALYIAANGRAYNEPGVYKIRQAIVNASLPQSQWNTNNTLDPDQNPEPLAIASTNWLVPVITASPANLNVGPGETAMLIAETSGLRPLTYQWLRNGSNVTAGGRISGADGNMLSISNAQPGDAGTYQIIITNLYGAATSAVANLTVGPCAGIAAPAGLMAWWRFDGDTRDWVGPNDGASLRGEVYGPAIVGNGLVLDARSGPILVPNSPALNPTNGVTIELWYKAEQFGERGAVLVRKVLTASSSISEHYGLLVTGNYGGGGTPDPTLPNFGFTFSANLFPFGGGSGRVYTPTNTWIPGNWYHLAGTYDRNEVKLYVNGELLGSSAHVSQFEGIAGEEAWKGMWIGGNAIWNASVNRFTSTNTTPGTIDDVSLYNRALTASEVTMLYSAGSAGKCASGAPTPILTVHPVTASADSVVLGFTGTPDTSWTVERAPSPTGAWTNLGPITLDGVGQGEFEDAEPLDGAAFYRARQP